jgi:hypothetical protein
MLYGKTLQLNASPFLQDIEEKLKQLDFQERKFKKKPAERQMDLF